MGGNFDFSHLFVMTFDFLTVFSGLPFRIVGFCGLYFWLDKKTWLAERVSSEPLLRAFSPHTTKYSYRNRITCAFDDEGAKVCSRPSPGFMG